MVIDPRGPLRHFSIFADSHHWHSGFSSFMFAHSIADREASRVIAQLCSFGLVFWCLLCPDFAVNGFLLARTASCGTASWSIAAHRAERWVQASSTSTRGELEEVGAGRKNPLNGKAVLMNVSQPPMSINHAFKSKWSCILARIALKWSGRTHGTAAFSTQICCWCERDGSQRMRQTHCTPGNCAAILHVLDDYEIVVINVFHKYNWFGIAIGGVRISCKAAEADARPESIPAQVMSRTGSSKSSQGSAPQSQSIEQQTLPKEAVVHVVASRGRRLPHCAAVFEFEDGHFSCELTALDSQTGSRFGKIDYAFQRQDGFTAFCNSIEYAALERPPLKVQTSPAELLQLCKTNPCNAKHYDITGDTCQRWLHVLFHNGLGIPSELLPKPVADQISAVGTAAEAAAAAGQISFCERVAPLP